MPVRKTVENSKDVKQVLKHIKWPEPGRTVLSPMGKNSTNLNKVNNVKFLQMLFLLSFKERCIVVKKHIITFGSSWMNVYVTVLHMNWQKPSIHRSRWNSFFAGRIYRRCFRTCIRTSSSWSVRISKLKKWIRIKPRFPISSQRNSGFWKKTPPNVYLC